VIRRFRFTVNRPEATAGGFCVPTSNWHPAIPMVELKRRLIKSPPEVWEELNSATRLGHWLGEVRLTAVDPLNRLEWEAGGASGVIELESLGWGTMVRMQAEVDRGPAWERLQLRYSLERALRDLLDDLSRGSLKRIEDPRTGRGC
jgi:hypothetical protein